MQFIKEKCEVVDWKYQNGIAVESADGSGSAGS